MKYQCKRIFYSSKKNKCRLKPEQPTDICEVAYNEGLMHFTNLNVIVRRNDVKTAEALLWGLSYITDGGDEHLQLALNHNIGPHLVEIIKFVVAHDNKNALQHMDCLILPALRILGNVFE